MSAEHRGRRDFLGLLGAAGALAVAGCSRTGSSAGGENGGPVTVKHVFGETTVPAPPRRVVSAGLTEQDDLLAVGVVPIAVTNWFGDQPFGVWPWARDELGTARPAVLNLDNGIDVTGIVALKPDLIVAFNAGLDAATYQKLSAIAPTIAQSGGDAFFEPWKDQATAIGAAVFKAGPMHTLIEGVEARFAAVAQANPSFDDKRAVLLSGRFTGDAVTATVGGWRTGFLTAMGLKVPEGLPDLIPRDELAATLAGVDVLIWTTESDAEKAALLADPAIAGLPANRNVFTGKDLAGAIGYASPLSYPVVADTLPPLLARTLA